jgi:hypothetical protein
LTEFSPSGTIELFLSQYETGKLFASRSYAPLSAIEQPWAQAVIRRGEHLAINAGYVDQPWRVTAEGNYEMLGGSTLESIAPFWKP